MELGGTSPAEVAHVVLVFVYSSASSPAPSTAHGSAQSALATRQQRPGRTRVPGTRRASSQNTTGCGTRSSFTVLSLPPYCSAPGFRKANAKPREHEGRRCVRRGEGQATEILLGLRPSGLAARGPMHIPHTISGGKLFLAQRSRRRLRADDKLPFPQTYPTVDLEALASCL